MRAKTLDPKVGNKPLSSPYKRMDESQINSHHNVAFKNEIFYLAHNGVERIDKGKSNRGNYKTRVFEHHFLHTIKSSNDKQDTQ